MAIKIIVDPNKGLYQEPAEEGASSFDVEAGVTLNGFGGGGGGTVIDGGATIGGVYEGNVLCLGDATFDDDVTVQGDLLVLGNLINDIGAELVVRGNLTGRNLNFNHNDSTAPQGNITVNGNMIVRDINYRQGGGVQTVLRVGGNLICNNTDGGSQINAHGNAGNIGADITVEGDISGFGSINLYGGIGASGIGGGGTGGNLTVGGNLTATNGDINLYGGNGSTYGNGGNGGTLTVYGNVVTGDYEVRIYGGTAIDNNGGNGGTIECWGNVTIEDIRARGGSVTYVSTGGTGGNGGNIYIRRGNLTVTYDVDIRGGNGNGISFAGGNGGQLTVKGNFNIADNDDAFMGYGGAGNNGALGGNGATITVDGDFFANSTISVYGGMGEIGGGNGGSITVEGVFSCTNAYTYGGDCAGTIATAPSGNGGNIECRSGFNCVGTVNTSGGERSGATTEAGFGAGGSAGNITVYGDFKADNVIANGGSVSTSFPDGAGGNGGTVSVTRGTVIIGDECQLKGGNSVGANGGSSGVLLVYNGPTYINFALTVLGGDSNNSIGVDGDAGVNGSVQTCSIFNGIITNTISFKDGSGAGTAPVSAAALEIGGDCRMVTLDVTNRANIYVRPFPNLPTTLKVESMPTKTVINNSDDAETFDLTGLVGGLAGNLFVTGIITGVNKWNRIGSLAISA